MNTSDQETLIINNEVIARGESKQINITMPELYDCSPLHMPVHVIRAKKPGFCLCVTAAIHGDELNGIEIARRLLRKVSKKVTSGTLIVIPIVNVYGFLYQDRYLMDRRDLNRAFPGTNKGSLASRLAKTITKEVVSQATHLIDLHAGSHHRTNLPQIRADLDDTQTRELAEAFNVPVILHSAIRDGSLREFAQSQKTPCLLYEAGESARLDELSIKTGVRGIVSVMENLGMLKQSKKPLIKSQCYTARHTYWIRAPRSGLFQAVKSLGKSVKEGELIAKIGNPTTTSEKKLFSPISGIIVGKNNLPIVHEGAALFNIARFEKVKPIADNIASWKDYVSESYDD